MTATTGLTSSIEHEIGPHGTLTLSIPVGTIQIRAVEGSIVRVRDVAPHEPQLRADQGPARLAVETPQGRGFRWGRTAALDVQVEVPAGARVEIDTTTAEVTALGLLGDQRIRTVSGGVRLDGGGGTIEVNGVAGDVWAAAAGRVEAHVRTVSGDVELRAPSWRVLEARTMSGRVHVEGRLLPGTHRIETVSGDATLIGTTDLTAEATTLTGDITTDLPHTLSGGLGRRSMRIGGGDAKVTFKSMSGDLAILRGDAHDAAATAAVDDAEASRLRVLEDLERGAIDVAEATRRLAALDHA